MKKSFLLFIYFLVVTGFIQAQDPAKLAKQAGRALTSYNIDPSNNSNKLEEAKMKINEALNDAEVQQDPGAWLTKGEIYNTILQRDAAARMINPNAKMSGDNDALVAFEAFKKGYELTDKKYQKADAVKGVTELQGHLINIGVSKYEAGEYDKAFSSFEAALVSHALLKENSQSSVLDDPAQFENQVYITALAAQLADRKDKAEEYYTSLYSGGTDKPAVYEGLFSLKKSNGDKAGAMKILDEGRKKFPDDPGLLFSEINIYLQEGRLEELISRLEKAIDQEPTNVSLYVTLGSVFDNLYQKE
ncbi:MAG: hypothetical protein EP344_17705, partial [Bacteroidetes bacterium]